jgi:hypothetical protein
VAIGLTLGGIAASAGLFVAADQAADPTVADYLSIAGLAVGAVGPSLGHVYAGAWAPAAIAAVVRGFGGLAFAYGAGAVINDDADDGDTWLLWGGLGMVVAATLYDLLDTPLAVRRANRRSVAVVPTVGGLALAAEF